MIYGLGGVLAAAGGAVTPCRVEVVAEAAQVVGGFDAPGFQPVVGE